MWRHASSSPCPQGLGHKGFFSRQSCLVVLWWASCPWLPLNLQHVGVWLRVLLCDWQEGRKGRVPVEGVLVKCVYNQRNVCVFFLSLFQGWYWKCQVYLSVVCYTAQVLQTKQNLHWVSKRSVCPPDGQFGLIKCMCLGDVVDGFSHPLPSPHSL